MTQHHASLNDTSTLGSLAAFRMPPGDETHLPASWHEPGTANWADLFGSVKKNLKKAVDDRAPVKTGASPQPCAIPLPRSAQEVAACWQALDRLQQAVMAELDRCHRMEQSLIDGQEALAHARTVLAQTQAGERHANHLAMHDPLTTLPNRRHFMVRLAQSIERASSQSGALTVMYLDLDGFKQINDLHGHDAGDELLSIIAARMGRTVRADDLVSRLGGDEFACLLSQVSGVRQLRKLACKVFDAVSAPIRIGDLHVTVRPSIGMARYPQDGDAVDALIKHADLAMYQAKKNQSGYAFFDEAAAGREESESTS